VARPALESFSAHVSVAPTHDVKVLNVSGSLRTGHAWKLKHGYDAHTSAALVAVESGAADSTFAKQRHATWLPPRHAT
jgi:hypothetical protein